MQNHSTAQARGKTNPQGKKIILRDIVVEQIRQLILTEKLQRGDRLPPERVLSTRFTVSRHLVREALRVLEQQQVIISRIGSGSYVESPTASRNEDSLTEETLRQRSNLMEIMEFRRAVEPRIAYLAAENAKATSREEGKAFLTGLLATMHDAMERHDTTAWLDADTAFHAYLAELTGNFLYEKTVELLHHGMIAFQAAPSPSILEQQFAASMEAHEAIAAAVLTGNGKEAASAMEQHIITTVQTALKTLPHGRDTG